MDDIKRNISSLPDSKIQELISLDKSDFQPGVYDLYLQEAQSRGICIQDKKANREKMVQTISAPIWKRFVNCLVDYSLLYIVFMASFYYPVRNRQFSPVFALLIELPIFVTYYVVCEYLFGKTLGKLVTGTRVVTREYKSPTFVRILKRTFSRLIPFHIWVLLYSGRIIHDSTSKTLCLEDKQLQNIEQSQNPSLENTSKERD